MWRDIAPVAFCPLPAPLHLARLLIHSCWIALACDRSMNAWSGKLIGQERASLPVPSVAGPTLDWTIIFISVLVP